MPERPLHRWFLSGVAAVYLAPLAVLVLRAAADVWRAPAVWPQSFGLRGLAQLRHPGVLNGITNSLLVAAATTVLAVALGWGAARVLAGRDHARRRLLYVLVALPLLVPPYAVGIGLGSWFVRWGLVDTRAALVLAHLVYVLPYVVLLLTAGFGRHVDRLEEAAVVLGAGAVAKLRLVTLPTVAPALSVACLLGFVVSWSQYGTSLAVGGGVSMLPLVLLPFVTHDLQIAAALSLLFVCPPLLALAVTVRLGRTR